MDLRPCYVYLIYIALISLAAFIAYGADKRRSVKSEWRISEKALLLLSLLGGAPGGLLGMKLFRHKTRHWYFWAINVLALILHISVFSALLIKF